MREEWDHGGQCPGRGPPQGRAAGRRPAGRPRAAEGSLGFLREVATVCSHCGDGRPSLRIRYPPASGKSCRVRGTAPRNRRKKDSTCEKRQSERKERKSRVRGPSLTPFILPTPRSQYIPRSSGLSATRHPASSRWPRTHVGLPDSTPRQATTPAAPRCDSGTGGSGHKAASRMRLRGIAGPPQLGGEGQGQRLQVPLQTVSGQ